MHGKYVFVDFGRQAQVIEYICAVSPDVQGAVLSQALIIESVDLCDLPGLVITSDQRNSVRIPYLCK